MTPGGFLGNHRRGEGEHFEQDNLDKDLDKVEPGNLNVEDIKENLEGDVSEEERQVLKEHLQNYVKNGQLSEATNLIDSFDLEVPDIDSETLQSGLEQMITPLGFNPEEPREVYKFIKRFEVQSEDLSKDFVENIESYLDVLLQRDDEEEVLGFLLVLPGFDITEDEGLRETDPEKNYESYFDNLVDQELKGKIRKIKRNKEEELGITNSDISEEGGQIKGFRRILESEKTYSFVERYLVEQSLQEELKENGSSDDFAEAAKEIDFEIRESEFKKMVMDFIETERIRGFENMTELFANLDLSEEFFQRNKEVITKQVSKFNISPYSIEDDLDVLDKLVSNSGSLEDEIWSNTENLFEDFNIEEDTDSFSSSNLDQTDELLEACEKVCKMNHPEAIVSGVEDSTIDLEILWNNKEDYSEIDFKYIFKNSEKARKIILDDILLTNSPHLFNPDRVKEGVKTLGLDSEEVKEYIFPSLLQNGSKEELEQAVSELSRVAMDDQDWYNLIKRVAIGENIKSDRFPIRFREKLRSSNDKESDDYDFYVPSVLDEILSSGSNEEVLSMLERIITGSGGSYSADIGEIFNISEENQEKITDRKREIRDKLINIIKSNKSEEIVSQAKEVLSKLFFQDNEVEYAVVEDEGIDIEDQLVDRASKLLTERMLYIDSFNKSFEESGVEIIKEGVKKIMRSEKINRHIKEDIFDNLDSEPRELANEILREGSDEEVLKMYELNSHLIKPTERDKRKLLEILKSNIESQNQSKIEKCKSVFLKPKFKNNESIYQNVFDIGSSLFDELEINSETFAKNLIEENSTSDLISFLEQNLDIVNPIKEELFNHLQENISNERMITIYENNINSMIVSENDRERIISIKEEAEPENLTKRVDKVLVDYFANYYPDISSALNDPQQLGRLKDRIIDNVSEYISQVSHEDISHEEKEEKIKNKLRYIAEKGTSSDTLLSEFKTMFLDLYLDDLSESGIKSKDDTVLGSIDIEDFTEEDSIDAGLLIEELKSQMHENAHNAALHSGAFRELSNLESYLANSSDLEQGDNNDEKLKSMAEEIRKDVRTNLKDRSETNKELAKRIEKGDKGPASLLPRGSVTHGTSSKILDIFLSQGNYCGELLDAESVRDSSGFRGVDTSIVLEDGEFQDKYQSLSNISYGDIHVIYDTDSMRERRAQNEDGNLEQNIEDAKKPLEQLQREGVGWQAEVIGRDHFNVFDAIASSEISAIVCKQERSLETTKKRIAENGVYIPVIDREGELLFTPEEFERLEPVYNELSDKGYQLEVIDRVVSKLEDSGVTISQLDSEVDDQSLADEEVEDQEAKERIILQKAYVKLSEISKEKGVSPIAREDAEFDFDLVALINFLRHNELNGQSVEEYQQQNFEDIYEYLQQDFREQNKRKAREKIFGEETAEHLPIQARGVSSNEELEQKREEVVSDLEERGEIIENDLIRDFLDLQLTYAKKGRLEDKNGEEIELDYEETAEYEQAVQTLLFSENSDERVIEAAEKISEVRMEALRNVYDQAKDELADEAILSIGESELDVFGVIEPVAVGSLGRKDMSMDSDVEYKFIIDEEEIPGDIEADREEIFSQIEDFASRYLVEFIQSKLGKLELKTDVQIDQRNVDLTVPISEVANFDVDLNERIPDIEPTELWDARPLNSDSDIKSKLNRALFVENENMRDKLVPYIYRDMIGEEFSSYKEELAEVFRDITSFAKESQKSIKESLQRPLQFKLYELISREIYEYDLDNDESGIEKIEQIPATTRGKIEFLQNQAEHYNLSDREADDILKRLFAFAYELRNNEELLSEGEGSSDLDISNFSIDQEGDLVDTTGHFKNEILNK